MEHDNEGLSNQAIYLYNKPSVSQSVSNSFICSPQNNIRMSITEPRAASRAQKGTTIYDIMHELHVTWYSNFMPQTCTTFSLLPIILQ